MPDSIYTCIPKKLTDKKQTYYQLDLLNILIIFFKFFSYSQFFKINVDRDF